jgi:hypothetical protein
LVANVITYITVNMQRNVLTSNQILIGFLYIRKAYGNINAIIN